MACYLAVDKDGIECIYSVKPFLQNGVWLIEDADEIGYSIEKGTIKKLIGRELTWSDNPVELKEVK